MVDYFVVKRGNIHTPSLFNPAPGSLYYYAKGWNLKALASWVAAAAFGIPGLVGAYHPDWVAPAAIHMYQTGWVICFAVAVTFYFLINMALPAKVFPIGHENNTKSFEQLAESEGYLDGEPIIRFRVVGMQGEHSNSSVASQVSVSEIVGSEKV